jgi:AraC-like DNA-binding protein
MAIRLEHAKLLLKDRSLTIKQVASRCGFSSESALASRFVDTTGVSPGLWRKSVYH